MVLRLARTLHEETGEKHLCLAGGVALNCVANGRIEREGPFESIWIQPAAGDAGGALGAAQIAWHEYFDGPRPPPDGDSMAGSFLGPVFGREEIRDYLDSIDARYSEQPDEELFPTLSGLLAQGKVVGWFQGRMEFGPRALGGRSILGDPRNTSMQSVMNLKIKYRESFRPFAPSVLAERVSDYFEQTTPSPYMLIVAPVHEDIRIAMTEDQQALFGIERLNLKRSELPAITHVDYSARVQTVHRDTNPRYHELIRHFEQQVDVIAHETPRERAQPTKFQLLEKDLPKGFFLLIAKEDLLPSRAGDDVDKTRHAVRLAEEELSSLSHDETKL